MRKVITVSALLSLAALVFAEPTSANRFEKVISRMVEAINEQDYAAIGKDFDQTMEDFFGLDKRAPFFKNLFVQYGRIRELDEPRIAEPDQAIFVASCERGKLDITVWLDENDKVIGLFFMQHRPDIPVPERNETKLSLPFKGRWLVVWGGDTEELNQHHHDIPSQRFAFDLLGVNEQGETCRGQAQVNEDYFAFGREILAPADGTVTDVITGVRDNVPGSMNPYSALGNAVLIQHREHEVSVLAHLKLGSVRVKVGDKVKAGQIVALCGNSGNSSEPHLHYHLQNTPIIQDGTGIKCYFEKITVMGGAEKESKSNYSPVKGDIVLAE
jgi:hypothetical protein